MDREDQVASSATEEQAEAVSTEEVVVDANAAGSSDADDEGAKQEPANLLDVVKSVVADPVEKAPEASPGSEEGKGEADPEAEAVEAKAEGEDETKVPFHEHPRWKELVAERNELKPAAERFQKIEAFMAESDLSSEEVAEGFVIMAALKGGSLDDRKTALKYLEDNAAALRKELGEELPDDLIEEVDQGLISEERAAEIARARAVTADRERREQREREVQETERQQQSLTEQRTAVVTAVQTWENGIKATDPDYSKKEKLVTDLAESAALKFVQTNRRAPTSEEAVQLTQSAYETVNSTFKAAVPKPRAVNSGSPSGSSVTATKAPANLRDAIKAAVGR